MIAESPDPKTLCPIPLPHAKQSCHRCGQPLGKVARVHLDGEAPEYYHMTCSRRPEERER